MKEREKGKSVAARAKQRLAECIQRVGGGRRSFRKTQNSTQSEGLLSSDFENLLTKPKVTVLTPASPKPSEATEGSDGETAPSYPALGVPGAATAGHAWWGIPSTE